MTTRRDILRYGAAAGALGLAGAPGRLRAAETLTGVTYLPQSYTALSYGSNGFVERLDASDAVAVDFYDSGKLLKADEQLPALRDGAIDFMFHTTSYVTRSIPILGITGLPNVVDALYRNPERLAVGSPLFELIDAELARQDLHCLSLGGGILEPEYIWSTEAAPIRSIADVDGKKIRVVGFEATGALERMGAAAVRIPSSELYLALQRGTVDAAVANISTINGRSLQEQLAYVYKLPVTAYGIGIFVTPRRWERMADDVRAAMTEAAAWFDANNASHANGTIYETEFWPKMREAGIEEIDAAPESLAALDEASEAVVAAWLEEVGEETGRRAIALALGEEA